MFESKNVIEFRNFSFIYGIDELQKPAVSDINFKLKSGEVLILAGPSGSGKSTISYALNGIIPWRLKGFSKGDVRIFEKSIWDSDFMILSKNVGLVKQNPLEQLVTFTVRDEIAFGLENLNYNKEEINQRIKKISDFMGIAHLLDRDIDQLSGGQKQLTILSSFLVMDPKILILDEPIAFLDQQSESMLLNQLKKLVKSPEYDLTLIIIEHRLSRVIDIADKLVVLNEMGRIALSGNIQTILQKKLDQLKLCNVRIPWFINIFSEIRIDHEIPMNFEEALTNLSEYQKEELKNLKISLLDKEIIPKYLEKLKNYDQNIKFDTLYINKIKNEFIDNKSIIDEGTNHILKIKNLNFTYPNSGIQAIDNLSLTIESGDFIGLVGPNGSGKTTLLYLLAGLYKPTSGEILYKEQNINTLNQYDYAKKIGFIFQNPENMIFKRTIEDEILYAPNNFNLLKDINSEYLSKLISLIGDENPKKNPFNLSWGQKRRLNLSSIFIYNPEIILLDEPFIGQDQKTIDSIIETLFIENKRGKTIIISSHDYHLLLKYTNRIVELDKSGKLQFYNKSYDFFQKHQNLGPIKLLNKIEKRIDQIGYIGK